MSAEEFNFLVLRSSHSSNLSGLTSTAKLLNQPLQLNTSFIECYILVFHKLDLLTKQLHYRNLFCELLLNEMEPLPLFGVGLDIGLSFDELLSCCRNLDVELLVDLVQLDRFLYEGICS